MSPELSLPKRLSALGGPRTVEVDPGIYDTWAGNACLWLSAVIGYAELRGMKGQREPSFVEAPRNSFRARHFHSWHREAVNVVKPLLDAVRERGLRDSEAPFHVPGHCRGRGAHAALSEVGRVHAIDSLRIPQSVR